MLTPARRQYLELKSRHPDALLLYRLGDFYELFDDDARVAARELHLTLTSREFGKGLRVPMAGIPYHALDSYLPRFLRKGFKVAICEQLSEPGHGLVDRAVVRVVSPGTVVESSVVPARENNFLAAVAFGRAAFGLAFVDVTTGEFNVTQIEGPDAELTLEAELERVRPAEVLLPPDATLPAGAPGYRTECDRWSFDPEAASEALCQQFGVATLDGFGCGRLPLAVGAAGAILAYLRRMNPALLPLLTGLKSYQPGGHLVLDAQTQRSLELFRSGRGHGLSGSLLGVLDLTVTPMGGRLLRRELLRGSLDIAELEGRLDAVAELVERGLLRLDLRALLGRLGDLERTAGRCAARLAGAREALALHEALGAVEEVRDRLADARAERLQRLVADLSSCPELRATIGRAVADPSSGRLIRPGYHADLDELVAAVRGAQEWIAALERRERERTGIRSLRVGFNKVFGYYLEVTRPNLHLVPPEYVRKQTVANGERYLSPELKEYEAKVLAGEARIAELERHLFDQVLSAVVAELAVIQRTAAALAQLDLWLAFAELAVRRGYCRPTFTTASELEIKAGRHPVVEAALPEGSFVPNDCRLDAERRVLLVTGPNMAGKSTYLRQVALIVLLAQIGSFVPARAARIGLVDRIFTRVGAQDDVAGGASTFLVEMSETAAILRHATERSLVLLDEVGRGTSTQDGLAIARAVLEDLHDRVGARTLFATHFHELTGAAERLPRLRNVHVAVAEEGGSIVFLHRIRPGGADRSYGLHVARLAGLPSWVVGRAEELLAGRERRNGAESDVLGLAHWKEWQPADPGDGEEPLRQILLALDLESLSPREAFHLLERLQALARRPAGLGPLFAAERAP